MDNRRRSERRPLALPVWIKDARGGERTETIDVSAHGISVVSDQLRPPRQYVELEIELPESDSVIVVTAMVARSGDLVDPSTGKQQPGMGLDFFLFDAKSKSRWQDFLRSHWLEEQTELVIDPLETNEVPVFQIRPRTLDRLWAFFRKELARRQVRIQSDVAKPPGSVVELVIIHPQTGAEWLLDGEIRSVRPATDGRQPMLDIALPGVDPALTEAFRAFVRSGRDQIQEEISLSVDHLDSVVINFGSAGSLIDEDDEDEPTVSGPDITKMPPAEPERLEPVPRSPSNGVFASFFQEAAAAGGIKTDMGAAEPVLAEVHSGQRPAMAEDRGGQRPVVTEGHAGQRRSVTASPERRKRRLHRNASVGSSPIEDQKLEVARARVVRRPKDIAASIELSFLLSAGGDREFLEEAIDVVRKVAALDPEHAGAQYRLAELFARKGDYRLARDHLAQAKRLGFVIDTDLERVVADGIKAG